MLDTFRPLLEAARGLDLSDPAAARDELTRRFDPDGPDAATLRERLVALLEDGQIAHKGELPVRFSRAAKPSPETDDHSIDVVLMTGPGPRHRHPQGEIDYCIALDGAPTFDGHPPGWVVYGPDSVHVPTVADGQMLIVYLLPGGGIEFLE
ncbi:MAG: DUF4863 family protein [Planctomycetota bacterium]